MPLTPHDHPAPVTRRRLSVWLPFAAACTLTFGLLALIPADPPPIPRAEAEVEVPPIPDAWPDRLDPALWPAIHRRTLEAARQADPRIRPVNERPPDTAPEPALTPVPGTLPSAVGPPPGIDLTGLAMHALARLSEVEARITRIERRLDGAEKAPQTPQERPEGASGYESTLEGRNARGAAPAAPQGNPTNGGGIAETPGGGPQS